MSDDLEEQAGREEFSAVGAYPAESAALGLAIEARLEDLNRLLEHLPPELAGSLLMACDRIIVAYTRIWEARRHLG